MRFTTDEKLIRSIIEDETVIGGFSDGKVIEDLGEALYLYDDSVGIFPVRTKGKVASMHAAIPKKNRGKRAVISCRKAADVLVSLGYTVIARVLNNDKKTRAFVRMVGFQFVGDQSKFKIYRY